jgi:hypothetical protein
MLLVSSQPMEGGQVMTWDSDIIWLVIYSILIALFLLAWAVFPA